MKLDFTDLTNIFRFSNVKFIEPESDADHTIWMELKALDYINYCYNKNNKLEVNKEKLIYKILTHDLDELVMCDIPRDIKYYSEESHSMIQKITKDLLEKSEIHDKIIDDINNAKSDTIEGQLVKYLDILSAHYKLKSEYLIQRSKLIREKLIENYDHLNHFVIDMVGNEKFDSTTREWIISETEKVKGFINAIRNNS